MIKFQQAKNVLCLGASYLFVSEVFAQKNIDLANSNPEICLSFASNEQRLACFDNTFNYVPHNSALAKTKEQITATSHQPSKTPLLDKRWELTDEHHGGLWKLRPYQPIYFTRILDE